MKIIKLVPADLGRSDIKSASSLINVNNRIYVCCDDLYDLFELQSNNTWIQHKWAEAPTLPDSKEDDRRN